MRILKNTPRQPRGATVAQVSFSDQDYFGAVGASEYRGIPVFAPRGIAYRPCEGDNLLLLPVDGSDACAGVLCENSRLEKGELLLTSAGGARIHMMKNGSISLNGVTITKNGEIILPEKGG